MTANSASNSRRDFLKTTAAGAAILTTAAHSTGLYAAGGDTIKVGLIGCGGRGGGAAENALNADPNVQLYAMADAFEDRLEASYNYLAKKHANKVDVPQERRFSGFDGYKQLIDSGVDVVLLATPPHFRPAHLEYAVRAGKHVFCEKPMAVDGPGVRSILNTVREARKQKLCVMSGFCFRYDPPKREILKRIHDGAIGDVLAMQVNYNTGPIWYRGFESKWSQMENQMRNWYYYTWLSGDFIVEQHVHNLDKAAWVMNWNWPVAAVGVGGRQVRTEERYGNIFDHHAVAFEYDNDVKLFSYCRQYPRRCHNDVSDHVIGSKGSAHLMRHHLTGPNEWVYEGNPENMYQVEHNELFAAIRAGEVINDMETAAYSTLMGIMGRMATYTGERVTWQKALDSTERLGPVEYTWGDFEPKPIAKPGSTRVV